MDDIKINLVRIGKSDPQLRSWMYRHYSNPKGFVGRQLIYKIFVGTIPYGAIVGGSATKYLPGRNAFFGGNPSLNGLVNNTFFHVEKFKGRYPVRNFTTKIISIWREIVVEDWASVYGDLVIGFETLVELPRSGELYRRDGWVVVGTTKGFTCKREGGVSTDSWSGRRVWGTQELRPKLVLCRKV